MLSFDRFLTPKREKKVEPEVGSSAGEFDAARAAQAAIEKAARPDVPPLPPIDTTVLPPASDKLSETDPVTFKPSDQSPQLRPKEVLPTTPKSEAGFKEFQIKGEDVEQALRQPTFDTPALPDLPIGVNDPHNPNQWGQDHASAITRHEVVAPTPVSEGGEYDLRTNPDLLKQALDKPDFAPSDGIELKRPGYDMTRARERTAPKQGPGWESVRLDPVLKQDAVIKPFTDLQARQAEEWRQTAEIGRQSLVGEANPFRTKAPLTTADEEFARAKKIVDGGSRHPDGIRAFRGEPVAPNEKIKQFLALRAEGKQVIDLAKKELVEKERAFRMRMVELELDMSELQGQMASEPDPVQKAAQGKVLARFQKEYADVKEESKSVVAELGSKLEQAEALYQRHFGAL